MDIESRGLRSFEESSYGLFVPTSQHSDQIEEPVSRNKHLSELDIFKKQVMAMNRSPRTRKFFSLPNFETNKRIRSNR